MNIALLIARLVLAVVFVVAGLAKLADRAGSRQALINFGVPARLATPGGILLPLAERWHPLAAGRAGCGGGSYSACDSVVGSSWCIGPARPLHWGH